MLFKTVLNLLVAIFIVYCWICLTRTDQKKSEQFTRSLFRIGRTFIGFNLFLLVSKGEIPFFKIPIQFGSHFNDFLASATIGITFLLASVCVEAFRKK